MGCRAVRDDAGDTPAPTGSLTASGGSEGRIHLELDGGRIPVEIRRRSQVESVHSGRRLTELHTLAVTTDDAVHTWLSGVLPQVTDTAVKAVDEADEYAGRWSLSWNAYGEVGGEHRYTLILKECEELNLDALLIDGVELHPYEYREEVAGDRLAIWAKLVGTEEEVAMLRRLFRSRGALPVVRKGIEEQPREMRLGLGEWTERDDRIEYRLVLVELGADESAHPDLVRIRKQNNRAAQGFYMNFAEQLVKLMMAKGVLTEAEVEEIREAASTDPVAVRNDFWRVVPDIEDR